MTEKSKSCHDRWTVGQSVLVSSTHLQPKTIFLLLPDRCGFVDMGRPLWREDVSVFYNCCWSSPVQSFSGSNPAGLMIIFYCLRFETPRIYIPRNRVAQLYPHALGSLSVASHDSQNYGGGIRTHLHVGINARMFFQIIYKNSFRTLPETHYVTATKANRLMLFKETALFIVRKHS
jgi:hypothetical protein